MQNLRRLMAALLMLAVMGGAFAQEAVAFEEVRINAASVVEGMFAAATGTTLETESEMRGEMTEEEIVARNAANALYRAKTLPWILAVLNPLAEDDLSEETSVNLLPSPEETAQEEIAAEEATEQIWTIEDSFAAFSENALGREYLDLLRSMGGIDLESCLEISRETCAQWISQVNHQNLRQENAHYVCWLYVPDSMIDYPVVQCEDNNRYLKRLFNGKRNASGTLFIDYRNLPDFQDPNTLIYGHHMRNDSMFGSLVYYETQAYYESHPYALILTEGAIYLLEFLAGYTTSDGDTCYDIAISDAQDMHHFLQTVQGKSDFVSEVDAEEYGRLVTLSTCAYAFRNARYIVIGKLTPAGQILRTEEEKIEATNDVHCSDSATKSS